MGQSGIEGSIAVVTGAGQGIGRAVAHALAAEGAVIAAVDRDPDRARAAAAELEQAGRKALGLVADVAEAAEVERLFDGVERDLGPVSLAVNVAGVLRTGAVTDCSDADWAELFAVNATGVFHVSRAAARRMRPRGGGCIITVGSNASGVPRADMAAYGASKAAATLFTKSLGLELAPHGIRCNVVSPGSTDTPMQRSMWSGADGAARTVAGVPERYRVGIPLGRIADPADIADAVCFLASDAARHITMHDLYVDGGATLRA
ncbi:2,3-dihydro-2,3-dihydroxybenzoate dehydrogenase [Spinactinospora alkalitolerans]|uniref:2,3-dihydro-2,3-dihydroxybenzoate dehydrogenase n=1 Tax=Spinactinospora alkalitolerans TaxID=687207 RepID=A0A852TVD6_9ACTN|nr:2,3-dihydro-2,3-dihydroxybenzoate dehydrogenase [Spinactinospora alkalitolerans]NYE46832.1 2,3-dihydro-2,3-dihydroxybenzoate dehydrogenase [Spinactinospora alkalitolerans]